MCKVTYTDIIRKMSTSETDQKPKPTSVFDIGGFDFYPYTPKGKKKKLQKQKPISVFLGRFLMSTFFVYVRCYLVRNANKRRYLIHWFECLSNNVPCMLLVGKACMTSNLQLLYCTSCRVVTYDVKQYSCENIRGYWTERPLDGSRVWVARNCIEWNCD